MRDREPAGRFTQLDEEWAGYDPEGYVYQRFDDVDEETYQAERPNGRRNRRPAVLVVALGLAAAWILRAGPDEASPANEGLTVPDSFVQSGQEAAPDTAGPAPVAAGLWASPHELSARTSGTAWETVLSFADSDWGSPDILNNSSKHGPLTLSGALAYAGLGEEQGADYRAKVISSIEQLVRQPDTFSFSTGIARQGAAYVIAAHMVDLPQADPGLDEQFRVWLGTATGPDGGSDSIYERSRVRPNNHGTNARAFELAARLYLGDKEGAEELVGIFKASVGEPGYEHRFNDQRQGEWQCVDSIIINPADCTIGGQDAGGILPYEQIRGGGFAWPPAPEDYVWGGLSGIVNFAELAYNAGYSDVYEWGDRAICRAYEAYIGRFGHQVRSDTSWHIPVINARCGEEYPVDMEGGPGTTGGFTAFTHSPVS